MEKGLLVDIGRKYWSIAELKRLVLLLQEHKLTHLQLHLNENEGFALNFTDSPVSKSNKSEFLLTDLSELTRDKFAAFYDDKLIAVYMKHPEKAGIWKPNKVLV